MEDVSTSSDAVEMLKAIVDVGALFRAIARRIRERSDVLKVHRECWMRRQHGQDWYGEGDGFGIEWYTDADFADDDRSLSFRLEVSWDRGQWRIQSDVRAVEGRDYQVLVELPTTIATEAGQLVAQLATQRTRLAHSQDEAVRLFLAGQGPGRHERRGPS